MRLQVICMDYGVGKRELPRFSNVCRLYIIKTRTERGRPGTEASLYHKRISEISYQLHHPGCVH